VARQVLVVPTLFRVANCCCRGSPSEMPGHVLSDGRLGHRKPEFEQLPMNAWRAPKHIFNAHPPDQCSQIRTDLRAASQVLRFATPVAAKTGTMPAHRSDPTHDPQHSRWNFNAPRGPRRLQMEL
jgi:hypothetical protein